MALTPPPSIAETPGPLAEDHIEAGMVVLDRIRSILPVAALVGMDTGEPCPEPHAYVSAVVRAAANGGQVPNAPGELGRLADGTCVCQFPSTVPAAVVPLKLAVVRDYWGVGIEQPDPTQLVLRRTAGGGGLFGGKKFGYEVTVLMPTGGKPVGEITLLGRTFGSPDQKCLREAADVIPKLIDTVRGQLANAQDRRRHPRVACGLAIALYPVHSDGAVDPAINTRCRDVSVGGLGFATSVPLQTKYAYVAFPGVAATAGHAVLIRLVRSQSLGTERQYGAQFRTDLAG
jgi:hypothetical protein